jgi:hypothetical protein
VGEAAGPAAVQFVNTPRLTSGVLTKRTYTVRNVNTTARRVPLLTKCTGKPGPSPAMPVLTFAGGYARHRAARRALGAKPVSDFTRREKW